MRSATWTRMLPEDAFFRDVQGVIAAFDDAERPRARHLIQELELLAQRAPALSERCYEMQARLFARLSEYERALTAVDRALELAPLDTGLKVLRGEIYQEQEAFSAALREYSNVLDSEPNAVTARMHRAELHQINGDPARALTDIDDALRAEPRSARLLYRRAMILIDLRRPNDAVADLRQVIALSPETELRQKAQRRLGELGIR